MKFKYTYIFIISMVMLSYFTIAQNNKTIVGIKLLTNQTEYEVGSTIILKFSIHKDVKPLLYCSNSYGSTLISPTYKNNTLQYHIPATISKKIGVINWNLIYTETSLLGTLIINPKPQVTSIESYIGPPRIESGGKDYTSLVVIPTDSLDNPVPTNTLVHANHQFLSLEKSEAIFTRNFIAYKDIYSKKESGRMLISSECLGGNSKEFTVIVSPAIPTNFSISVKRVHDYADGNQITTFLTSILKDQYNNIVNDGTYVSFYITNQNGDILKTSGTTAKGIAHSKIVHPDYKDNWRIKAYVDGIAESNTIKINYKQVIKDFKVSFSENNRVITVGPLQSFMQQMIPDGLQIKLQIYNNNNTLLKTYTKTTRNGFVSFNLKSNIFKSGIYNFNIKTAGLEKIFNTKKLW